MFSQLAVTIYKELKVYTTSLHKAFVFVFPDVFSERLTSNNLHPPFSLDPRCGEALKPGNCGDYVVRWYYDKQVNSCARFWFSGCNGSGNRFHSEKECQEACIK